MGVAVPPDVRAGGGEAVDVRLEAARRFAVAPDHRRAHHRVGRAAMLLASTVPRGDEEAYRRVGAGSGRA